VAAVTFAPPIDAASLASEGAGASEKVWIANALRDRVAAFGEPMLVKGTINA
jgi:hypothetical protein